MALSSVTQMRSSIKDWAVRDDLSDTLIDDFLVLTESALNYGDQPNELAPLRVREMETTATVTVTSGVGSLPDDFLEVIKVKDPGDTTRNIEYATPEYTIIGSDLYCTIDVSLTYYAKIPSITTNSTNWLLTKAPNAYLWGGLMQYSIYDKDVAGAAGYRGLMIASLNALGYSDLNSRAGMMTRRSAMPVW